MAQEAKLHPSLYNSHGWNTNEMHKGQENHRLKRQDAEPIQGSVDPNFCLDKQGTPMSKGDDGLLRPARAFSDVATFMAGFAGFTPYAMNPEGTLDGSPNPCTTAGKPECESIVPCGAWRADVKEPGIFCVGNLFKLCVDPETGKLSDCMVEPTDDPAEAIGAVEKFESGWVCDDDGNWNMTGNQGTVLLRAGMRAKKGIGTAAPIVPPAEEETEEGEG